MMSATDLDREPNLRKVAVIGDIHCEDERLAAVLGHFAILKVDATLAVGDTVDGEGDANRAWYLSAEYSVTVGVAPRSGTLRWRDERPTSFRSAPSG
jgi:hypothetical protein